jgi:hypothetical protein
MELTVSMSEQGQLIWIWLSVRKDGLSQSIFLTILFMAGHMVQFYMRRNLIVKPIGLWYHKHIKKFSK